MSTQIFAKCGVVIVFFTLGVEKISRKSFSCKILPDYYFRVKDCA